jgi:predicted nucleic acid-binding protein
MLAVVCAWHEHHERAVLAVNRRLDARQTMVIPAPALIESYAVLTRLPSPHRLSTADARYVLDANFGNTRSVVGLDGGDSVDLLRSTADPPIVGGRIYDAVIARCATKGQASAILTFNDRHFRSLGLADLTIVVP